MFGLSVTELLVILAIVLLLFGTRKLRNLGGDLGGAIKGFRKAMKDEDTPPEEKPYLEGEREDSDLNRTTTGTRREHEEDRQQR